MAKLTGPVQPVVRIVPPLAQDKPASLGPGRSEPSGPGFAERSGRVSAPNTRPQHVAMLRMADHTDKRPGEPGPGDPNVQGNYRALVDEFRVEATSGDAPAGDAAIDSGPVMDRIRLQQVLRALDETERLSSADKRPAGMTGEVLDAEDPMQGEAAFIDVTPPDPKA